MIDLSGTDERDKAAPRPSDEDGATNVDHRIRVPTFPCEQGGGNFLALNQGRCHHPMIRC
ncbi:hypothetical protein ACE6H2_011781 [Prunus campanulata]